MLLNQGGHLRRREMSERRLRWEIWIDGQKRQLLGLRGRQLELSESFGTEISQGLRVCFSRKNPTRSRQGEGSGFFLTLDIFLRYINILRYKLYIISNLEVLPKSHKKAY